MKMPTIFKIAPLLAGAALLTACDPSISIDMDDGVVLSELDLSGKAPTEIVLAGPDIVNITPGSFDIQVTGDSDAIARMRFKLEDGTLSIMREEGEWSSEDGVATVNITMPAPEDLTIAGSGSMTSAELAGDADVTIAGSGSLETASVDANKLEVTIAGSGSYTAAGHADALELSVLGSGNAAMAGLTADDAEVTVAGSGNAEFASDGKVEVDIAGSGNVAVSGSASCTLNSVGSGQLTCGGAQITEQ